MASFASVRHHGWLTQAAWTKNVGENNSQFRTQKVSENKGKLRVCVASHMGIGKKLARMYGWVYKSFKR